jgi:hypothetical protein
MTISFLRHMASVSSPRPRTITLAVGGAVYMIESMSSVHRAYPDGIEATPLTHRAHLCSGCALTVPQDRTRTPAAFAPLSMSCADPMAPILSPRPHDLVLRRSPSFLAASMSRTPSILCPQSISALTAWSFVFPIGRRPSTPKDTDLCHALAEWNILLQHEAIMDRYCDMHSLECSKMTTTTMKEVPPR